jgi:hypothetical protein
MGENLFHVVEKKEGVSKVPMRHSEVAIYKSINNIQHRET